jgi:hypothetical protein
VEWDFVTQTLAQGSFPVVVQKKMRGQAASGAILATIRAQAQQRWQWPQGTVSAIGYVI